MTVNKCSSGCVTCEYIDKISRKGKERIGFRYLFGESTNASKDTILIKIESVTRSIKENISKHPGIEMGKLINQIEDVGYGLNFLPAKRYDAKKIISEILASKSKGPSRVLSIISQIDKEVVEPPKWDERIISKLYRHLAMIIHPDKNKDDNNVNEAFGLLTKAYEDCKKKPGTKYFSDGTGAYNESANGHQFNMGHGFTQGGYQQGAHIFNTYNSMGMMPDEVIMHLFNSMRMGNPNSGFGPNVSFSFRGPNYIDLFDLLVNGRRGPFQRSNPRMDQARSESIFRKLFNMIFIIIFVMYIFNGIF